MEMVMADGIKQDQEHEEMMMGMETMMMRMIKMITRKYVKNKVQYYHLDYKFLVEVVVEVSLIETLEMTKEMMTIAMTKKERSQRRIWSQRR